MACILLLLSMWFFIVFFYAAVVIDASTAFVTVVPASYVGHHLHERGVKPIRKHRNGFVTSMAAGTTVNKQPWRSKINNDKSQTSNNNKKNIKSSPNVCLARAVAIRSLTLTKTQHELFSTTKLEQDQVFQMLETRDRSFARLLVGTVERRVVQIDQILSNFVQKSPNNKSSSQRVQACLRVGVAQLLFLKTPPHAAVQETVQTLRWKQPNNNNPNSIIPESTIKFVNAVLRGVSRLMESNTANTSLFSSPEDALQNISPWLVDEWKTSWGDNITAIMANMFIEPPSYLDLSSKVQFSPAVTTDPTAASRSDQLEMLRKSLEEHYINLDDDDDVTNNKVSVVILPHGTIRIKNLSGSIASNPTFSSSSMNNNNEGSSYWVQDASAAIPAIALHNALRCLENKGNSNLSSLHVVDMCSAPGGKTSQLLSMGFKQVTSIEASPRRNKRLLENLERLGFHNHTVAVIEGQHWLPDDNMSVAGILLDAPCSSTGTASRKPDVLRKSQDQIESLLATQRLLLTHCVENILQVGGIVVYSTCSLLQRESEDQIRDMLQRTNDRGECVVKSVPFVLGEIPGFDESIDIQNGWMRVLPGVLPNELRQCDGFFIARLMKIADTTH